MCTLNVKYNSWLSILFTTHRHIFFHSQALDVHASINFKALSRKSKEKNKTMYIRIFRKHILCVCFFLPAHIPYVLLPVI